MNVKADECELITLESDIPQTMEQEGPQSCNWERVRIGANLVPKAVHLLDFLVDVNKYPQLLASGAVVNRAIQRYETVWLPLAAGHQGTMAISPPLDVHWIWCCHMLAPISYIDDCHIQVGRLVEHTVLSRSERRSAQDNTRTLWERTTHLPYDIPLDSAEDKYQSYKQRCQYDLVTAAMRQAEFYYQVSLPHFRDETFLEMGLIRYKKQLHLASRYPDVKLVPCYDIDIIWHTHQLHPEAYAADTLRILGKVYSHDDAVVDRNPGATLSVAEDGTRHLWKSEYREEHRCPGAMYRGPSPKHDLKMMSKQYRKEVCPKVVNIKITEVQLTRDSGVENCTSLEMHCGSTQGRGEGMQMLFKLNMSGKTHHTNTQKGLSRTIVNTKHPLYLGVVLYVQKGKLQKERYEGHLLDFHTLAHSCTDRLILDSYIRLRSKTSADTGLSLAIKGVFTLKIIEDCVVRSKSGKFIEMTLPCSTLALWGCRSLISADEGERDPCILAVHVVQALGTKAEIFSCQVMHSVRQNMSSVRVSYNDRAVAMAHLIYSSHLPVPKQVSGVGIPLDPNIPERAMIIKDGTGDRAIIKAIWRGRKPASVENQKKGDIGELEVSIYELPGGRSYTTTIQPLMQNLTTDFLFDQFKVNFGMEIINAGVKDSAVQLCKAYAVAVLYALCEPRRVDADGLRIPTNRTKTSKDKFIMGHDWPLVMAAGYDKPCPSCSYLHQHKHQYRNTDSISKKNHNVEASACVGQTEPRNYDDYSLIQASRMVSGSRSKAPVEVKYMYRKPSSVGSNNSTNLDNVLWQDGNTSNVST